jgi:hypothetical protein
MEVSANKKLLLRISPIFCSPRLISFKKMKNEPLVPHPLAEAHQEASVIVGIGGRLGLAVCVEC